MRLCISLATSKQKCANALTPSATIKVKCKCTLNNSSVKLKLGVGEWMGYGFVKRFLLVLYPDWNLMCCLCDPYNSVKRERVIKRHLISTLKMLKGKLPWKLIIRNSKYDHHSKTRNDPMYWFNFDLMDRTRHSTPWGYVCSPAV